MSEQSDIQISKYPLNNPSWMKADENLIFGDCVYLIQMGNTNYFKIGRSFDPRRRLMNLQTGNPLTLRILWIIESPEAGQLESWFHGKLKRYGTEAENEWFKLNDKAIAWFKQFRAYREPTYDEMVKLRYLYTEPAE